MSRVRTRKRCFRSKSLKERRKDVIQTHLRSRRKTHQRQSLKSSFKEEQGKLYLQAKCAGETEIVLSQTLQNPS